jgi:hypothetical protein
VWSWACSLFVLEVEEVAACGGGIAFWPGVFETMSLGEFCLFVSLLCFASIWRDRRGVQTWLCGSYICVVMKILGCVFSHDAFCNAFDFEDRYGGASIFA